MPGPCRPRKVGGGDRYLGSGVDGCWSPGTSRIQPSVHLDPPSCYLPSPQSSCPFPGRSSRLGATASTLPRTGKEGAILCWPRKPGISCNRPATSGGQPPRPRPGAYGWHHPVGSNPSPRLGMGVLCFSRALRKTDRWIYTPSSEHAHPQGTRPWAAHSPGRW